MLSSELIHTPEVQSVRNYMISDIVPDFAPIGDQLLGAYSRFNFEEFSYRTIAMSPLRVARSIDVVHEQFPGIFFTLGGIGQIRVNDDNTIHIKHPSTEISLQEFIQQEFPPDYTGMKSSFVRPNGKIETIPSSAPLGGHKSESALKKWKKTFEAHQILEGIPNLFLPIPVALLFDTDYDFGGIVLAYPGNTVMPSQLLEEGKIEEFQQCIQLLGTTLRAYHEKNAIHKNPGGNWMAYESPNGLNLILKDFSGYSVEGYKGRHKLRARKQDIVNALNQNVRLIELFPDVYNTMQPEEFIISFAEGYSDDLKIRDKILNVLHIQSTNFGTKLRRTVNMIVGK